ncbi:MAG: tRNA pseudouridine(55) synthase TruB [Bacteroidota bacterium]
MKERTFNFPEGEVLLVDKPLHWTSFDVVNKIRYKIRHHLHMRKIKVGHAGTLDPLATGLLIVCTGKKTRQVDQFQAEEKEYTGTIELGRETPSYDLETETSKTHSLENLSGDRLHNIAAKFTGMQKQLPPVFSAKKIDGKRAYKYARKNEEVELQEREVFINDFSITRIYWPYVDFKVICSKGTYIRSLAHDFGKALNNGACLVSLRRTRSGNFDVKDAWLLDDLFEAIALQKTPDNVKAVIFDFNRTLYDPEKENLMEGARRLLNSLKKRGIKMALLSVTSSGDREQLIASLDLHSYFEETLVLSGNKEPEHFVELSQKMQVDPEKCLVIGDRIKQEIHSANLAGMKTCWLQRGKFKKEKPDIQDEKPDYTINNLHEVFQFF